MALRSLGSVIRPGLAAVLLAGCTPGASPEAPPQKPAQVDFTVAPEAVAAGEAAWLRVRLAPAPGIKINRYPKIKLEVVGQEGLVRSGGVAIGNEGPPPVENPEANYFKTVDPLELRIDLDPSAPRGRHQILAELTYYYCVSKSGYCTRDRVSLKVPLTVR